MLVGHASVGSTTVRHTGITASLPWGIALALALALPVARAQQERPPLTISIEPPARVALGDRGQIVVLVIAGPSAARPLLVTPTSEGAAIEIVQGRFTRADAQDPDDEVLRFEVPFVARTAGTSVVRVRVDGFTCDEARCQALALEQARAVEVLPR